MLAISGCAEYGGQDYVEDWVTLISLLANHVRQSVIVQWARVSALWPGELITKVSRFQGFIEAFSPWALLKPKQK